MKFELKLEHVMFKKNFFFMSFWNTVLYLYYAPPPYFLDRSGSKLSVIQLCV